MSPALSEVVWCCSSWCKQDMRWEKFWYLNRAASYIALVLHVHVYDAVDYHAKTGLFVPLVWLPFVTSYIVPAQPRFSTHCQPLGVKITLNLVFMEWYTYRDLGLRLCPGQHTCSLIPRPHLRERVLWHLADSSGFLSIVKHISVTCTVHHWFEYIFQGFVSRVGGLGGWGVGRGNFPPRQSSFPPKEIDCCIITS